MMSRRLLARHLFQWGEGAVNGCTVCGFMLRLPIAALTASDVGLCDDGRHPGRLLVSSRAHFAHVEDVPAYDLQLFMADVQRTCRALRSLNSVQRVDVIVLSSREQHVHAQLIPRRPGDWHAGEPWESPEPRLSLESAVRIELINRIRELLIV